MLLLSLLSVRYFVKFHSSKLGLCHPYNPCTYPTAEKLLDSDSEVYIMDKLIQSKTQLDGFRSLVEKAAKFGAKVYGMDTVIDGSGSPLIKSLITLTNSPGVVVGRIKFQNFAIPIIKIRNSDKIILSNITIQTSKTPNIDPLISTKNSSVLFNRINFLQNRLNSTSFFSFTESKISFNEITFLHNFQTNVYESPFISCFNTKFKIRNTEFIRCATQYSALIDSKYNSIVKIINSTFEEPRHLGLIKSFDGKSKNLISNCTFNKYYDAVIISNDDSAETKIEKTTFASSFGYTLNSFLIKRGKLTVSDSIFYDNSGFALFNISGVSSSISIYNSIIYRNKLTKHILVCNDNSNIEIKNSEIKENNVGNFSIHSNLCFADIDKNLFYDNYGTILFAEGGNFKFTYNYIQSQANFYGSRELIYKESIIFDDKGTDIIIKNNSRVNHPFLEKYTKPNMLPITTPVQEVPQNQIEKSSEKPKEKRPFKHDIDEDDNEESDVDEEETLPQFDYSIFEKDFSKLSIDAEATTKYVPLAGKITAGIILFVVLRFTFYLIVKL